MSKGKLCAHCGRLLAREAFYSHPSTRDGLTSWCKSCTKQRAKNTPTEVAPVAVTIRLKQQNDARQDIWLKHYLDQWTCAHCGCTDDLGLYSGVGETALVRAEDYSLSGLRHTALLNEVWCAACFAARRYEIVSPIKLRNRQALVPEMIKLADLYYHIAIREEEADDERVSTVVTSKVDLASQVLDAVGCSLCGEEDTTVLDFFPLGKEKRRTLKAMLYDATPIGTVMAELGQHGVVCANCRLRVKAHPQIRSQIRPISVQLFDL